MRFRFSVDYRHGDARQWCDGTLPSTLVKANGASHGDLIVFDAGVCGADATTGHIAVIDCRGRRGREGDDPRRTKRVGA